jgi:hypothetical protein
MPGNERKLWLRQVAVDDVQVGPADTARMNPQKHLPGLRLGRGHLLEAKRLPLSMEHHRTHAT